MPNHQLRVLYYFWVIRIFVRLLYLKITLNLQNVWKKRRVEIIYMHPLPKAKYYQLPFFLSIVCYIVSTMKMHIRNGILLPLMYLLNLFQLHNTMYYMNRMLNPLHKHTLYEIFRKKICITIFLISSKWNFAYNYCILV